MHLTQVVKLLSEQSAQKADFTLGHALDRRIGRDKAEAAGIELSCKMGRWPTPKRPAHEIDVFLAHTCLILNELVDYLGVSQYFLF